MHAMLDNREINVNTKLTKLDLTFKIWFSFDSLCLCKCFERN